MHTIKFSRFNFKFYLSSSMTKTKIIYFRDGNSNANEIRPDSVNNTRNVFLRRFSNVRAGLVRSRRNIMSMFHNQQSDEIELSGD